MVPAHSQATASGSAPASGSASTSAPLPSPSAPSHVVKRRRYARRSCLTCRSKKTRCELPDEAVASSHDPLPIYKACHRCRALDIPCVVWDGDRKRKPRLTADSSSSSSSLASAPLPSSRMLPSPAQHRESHHHQHYPSRREQTAYADDALHRSAVRDPRAYAADPFHSPRDWHANPSTSSADPPSSSRRAHLYERSRPAAGSAAPLPSSSASISAGTAPPPSAIASTTTATDSTPTNAHYGVALFINDPRSNLDGRRKPATQEKHILTNYCLHSPLITLNRFIAKIPSFSRLLRPEMDRTFDGQLSSLLTDENMDELQAHLPRLRLWHPHISDLASLRTAYCERPKPSTSLLIATVCLIASKIAGKRHLAKHFAIHVDRIGLQVLLSAPKEVHAAQAFELLLSHEPSLIGASVDPSGSSSSSSSNNSAVFGESLHSSALAIAEAIGLDLVMSQASPNLHEQDIDPRESDDKLRWQLQRFSLWCSLSIWRAKFLFLNSTIRPYDFSRLSQDAQLAITLVDRLLPRGRTQADFLDETMFKAGVVALAHRAIHVADFHQRLSQIETLWHSRSLFSDAEVRSELRSRAKQHARFLDELKSNKRYKLWRLGNLDELRFINCWIDLEIESDSCFLFCTYSRFIMPLSEEYTVADLSQSFGRDADLFAFFFELGQLNYSRTESALAGLASSRRFEGQSIEQTGLPLLLTCGYVLYLAVVVMEGVSFLQLSQHETAIRAEMFALIFPQLAERLCGPQRSEIESLEKLVSSMLVQMARRSYECDYLRVVRSGPPSADPMAPPALSNDAALNHSQRRSSQMSVQGAPPHAYTQQDHPHSAPQSNATPASDSSLATNPNTPSLGWNETSNTSQSDSSRQGARGSSSSSHGFGHTNSAALQMPLDRSNGLMPASTASVMGAASFPDSAASLLASSDPFSTDNMARIMDQILAWDYGLPMDSMPTGDTS